MQMSSSNVCVMELLSVGLIAKLESQIRRASTVKESINNKNDIWKDISLMLLAVVAYAADDLLEEDQIKIVRILRIVCTDTSSTSASYGPVIEATDYTIPVDIIENCANVLKFISIKYNDFEELDTVVRTILTLTDNEEVVAQMSCVLYNMTCSAKNIPLMLTDGTYINFMIQIMRKGKVEVQENIAQAIRTLCSDPKSPQLLLKKDILSDLIVIALLRTSSEEIKIVCSQAFYNMLCHEPTRLRLLEG